MALTLCAITVFAPASAASASAAEGFDSQILTIVKPEVIVVEVTGLLDRSTSEFVSRMIRRAESTSQSGNRAIAVLLQINSKGGVLNSDDLASLSNDIKNSSVPVAAWIGPTNARTYGQATELLNAVDLVGMAPGARVGKPSEDMDVRSVKVGEKQVLTQEDALQQRLAELPSPTLAQFLLDMNNRVVDGKTLQTSVVGNDVDGKTVTQESVVPVFTKPSITARLMHSVNTPGVAEFLLVGGMLLLMFEFLAAGAGVVGVCGAICVWLGFVGAVEVGVNPLGFVALFIAGALLLSDLQTGVVRSRAMLGVVVLGASQFLLFDRFEPSLLAHAVIWAPSVAFALLGIPVMVRTRFSVGIIDRSPLVGRSGPVSLARDGVASIQLDGLAWMAKSSDRIKANCAATVDSVEDHMLVVVAATTKSLQK